MSNRNTLAAVPPMGWNSYMCYGVTVREEEVTANARYLADHLLPFVWQYVVVADFTAAVILLRSIHGRSAQRELSVAIRMW